MDFGMAGSIISKTICKQSAPHSRQIKCQHLVSQFSWVFSWCPANSIKELKVIHACCKLYVMFLTVSSMLWQQSMIVIAVFRGDRQQMMDAAAADASRQPAAGPEDPRSGLIYNDDAGRADPFVGQKGPPPGEPQRWNYWCHLDWSWRQPCCSRWCVYCVYCRMTSHEASHVFHTSS